MKLDTDAKRYFAVVWAIFEVLIFGGIMFGWGSLVYVLKSDGIYFDMCLENPLTDEVIVNNTTIEDNIGKMYYVPENGANLSNPGLHVVMETSVQDANQTYWTDPCLKQDRIFNLGFSIICALVTYGTLATGQFNYKIGTRYTRLLSFIGFVAGSLMVAFTSQAVPWLVFPGMLLIGVTGFTIFFTNVQVAFLFIKSRSIIVSMLSGSLATSVATQQFVKIAYDNGVSLKLSYIFLACLHSIVLISTYGWLPKMFFASQKSYTDEIKAPGDDKSADKDKGKDEPSESDDLTGKERRNCTRETKAQTGLRSYTMSSSYVLHLLWFCVLQLRFHYYIGTVNPYISSISNDIQEVSRLTNISLYIMMGGFFMSVLSGAFYDIQVQRYSASNTALKKHGPSILPLIFSSLLGISLSAVQMIFRVEAVLASFVLLTVFRGFLFSVANAYLGARFPSTHFGILHGIMLGTGGTISLLQYALFNWTEAYEGSLQHVNICLICLTSLSLVHPLCQWLKLRKANNNNEDSHI